MTLLEAAVFDADILVPILACDFLLTAFDHGLIEPIVSATALDEVDRTLAADFPYLVPEAAQRRVELMRKVLGDQIVNTSVIGNVPDVINRKDRHVVAAALIAEVKVVVTNDSALRTEITDAALDLAPLDGNAFAKRLWDAAPTAVSGVVDAMISKRRRRPTTASEMAGQLRVHFPLMADAWEAGRR